MTTPIANIDNATLNLLSPNLDIGDVADPALRLAYFQYLNVYIQTITTAFNAFVANGGIATANLADLSVTSAKLADLAVATGKIADLAVVTAKINDLAVTAAKIAVGTITSTQIADLGIATGDLADALITTIKIADANVTTAKLIDSCVTLAKMADASVGTAELVDLSVTTAKIAIGAVGVAQLSPAAAVNETVNNALIVALKADVTTITHLVGPRLGTETDDTARIQRAIDASYGAKLKIPAGTYYINPIGVDYNHNGLSIVDSIDIEMDSDTILQCLAQSVELFSVITIYNTSNVTIKGGQIVGERTTHIGTTGEHGMGINIFYSTNVTIDNVRLRDHWGDCIYIGGLITDGSMTLTSGVVIRNCRLDNSRRQGLSVTMGDGIFVEDCRITNINGTAPQYGMDIETNNPAIPVKNVKVSRCYFAGSVSGGFVVGAEAEDISVNDCTFNGNAAGFTKTINGSMTNCKFIATSVTARSSTGIIIANNNFESSDFGITVNGDAIYETTIMGNTFYNRDGSTSRKAISLTGGTDYGCIGLNITGNQIYNYISDNIYIFNHVSNALISNNTIKTNALTRWVCLIRGSDIQVSNNNIEVSFAISAAISSIISGILIRGSFKGNSIKWLNITVGEAVLDFLTYSTETIGATISDNILNGNVTGNILKLPSSGTTKYKVQFNDFRYSTNLIQNGTNGHFLYENVFSTTSKGGGSLTYSGDGVATTKTIPHGLLTTPTEYNVIAGNLATGTAGIKFITADATNITVTFNAAPASGSSNIKLLWSAKA